MRVEEIVDLEVLAALAPAWSALAAASDSPSIFMTPEWMLTWWRHFAGGQPLCALAAFADDALVGLLPLRVEEHDRRGVSLRTLHFAIGGASDRHALLVDGDPLPVAHAFARHLRQGPSRWHALELSELAADAPSVRAFFDALGECGIPRTLERGVACPYLPIEEDWDAFFARRISAKTRSNNRNKTRKFEAMGKLAVRWITETEEVPAALRALRAVEERDSYHGHARHRPFDGPADGAFFEELLTALARRGWLQLAVLELDGVVVAYRIGFRFGGRHFDFFPGFATDYTRLSPGRLLVTRVLEDCFRSGVREVDFLRGFEDWKAEWTDRARDNALLRAANPSFGAWAARLIAAPRETLRAALRGGRPAA